MLRNRQDSERHGHTASEYALNIRKNTLSDYPTRELVRENRPALPEKSDTQDTVKQNTLIPYIVPSLAHNDGVLKTVVQNIENVFNIIKTTNDDKQIIEIIEGNIIKPVFRKWN